MADFKLSLHCKYYWRLLAHASASAIHLIMCITCKPVSPILLAPAGFATSPQAPESSKFSSKRVEYYNYYYSSRQQRSSSLRILDDDEYPYSRPSPRSYPLPQDNVQTFGVYEHGDEHARASPPSMGFQPQFKRSHSPSAPP